MIVDGIHVMAASIGIKSENDFSELNEKKNWFYNVCEILEYANSAGKRLADISREITPEKYESENGRYAIEANSVVLTVLNLVDSFNSLFIFRKNGAVKEVCPLDVKYECKFIREPKNDLSFRLRTSSSFQGLSVPYKLLHGLRNALVHRHPVNTRNVRFWGSGKRMGISLAPFEFGNDRDIKLSPRWLENPKARKQIGFIRDEPFVPVHGYASEIDKWFAWENGRVRCYLDCEDLGENISELLSNVLSKIVKQNDNGVRELLILLREIGDRDIYFPEKHVSPHFSHSIFYVFEPVLNRLACHLKV